MQTPHKGLRPNRQPKTTGRQCGYRKNKKALAVTAFAFVSLSFTAQAQSPLFTLTGGAASVATQATTAFAGNWYHATPAQAPTLSGSNALISGSTGPFAFGNASATIPASPGSGGNKIVFPGNKSVSSFTLANLNPGALTNPVLNFNLILLGGNGNPSFTATFSGSFGTSQLTVPAVATNAWTGVSIPVPAAVLNANSPVSLTFKRTGNTNGANGAHFWAIDDIALAQGAPAVNPCPAVAANTFAWHGAGTGSGNSSTDFNDLNNWCPQPTSVSALGAGTLQLHLTQSATLTLDANFTAAALDASISGNGNRFLLNLNGHSFTVTGNANANIASGDATTELEIKTGTGTFTVNGTAQVGTSGSTGKVGFSGAANAGTLTFNGPVSFGPAAEMFAPSPKTVNIKANLANSSAAIATTGFAQSSLIFNGASAQTISGTQDIRCANLTVNNAQDVTSTAVNLLVPGVLTMTNGLLNTAEQAKVKLGATGQLSEKVNSQVVGYIEVQERAISGSPQSFGGLGLTITSDAGGTYATTVNRITSLYSFTIYHGNSHNSVEKQAIKRKYQVGVANAPADLDATLTVNYWAHEMAGIETEDMGFFRENPSQPGTWTSRGRDTNALNMPSGNMPGSITLSNIKAFSTWSVGGGSTPLPVELLWYTAKNERNTAVLEWATATEQNNAGFQIEASNDGLAYEIIGFISAAANRNHTAEYQFSEPQQANRRGPRYYRLTQIDQDGTETRLGIRSVMFQGNQMQVITSPNPFTYGFTALVESDKPQQAHITLIDGLGRAVNEQTTQLEAGLNQIDINGFELAKGTYLLRVRLQDQIITTRVVKQ